MLYLYIVSPMHQGLAMEQSNNQTSDESKIVIALKKFMRDYAWDITLSPKTHQHVITPRPASPEHLGSSAMAIEEFINAARK